MPRYVSFESLCDAGANIAFSDPAFRLRWRLFLTGASASPISKATSKTEWRVLPSVPGIDGADLTYYIEDDADFASTGLPWSDTHPIANEALTDPPIGRIDIRIDCLESYVTLWPDLHRLGDCYHPDINPDACEGGFPVYRAPPPLRIEPAEKDFVTIVDYVREVGRWMESDVIAHDLASWWPQAEYMRDGKAVANGSLLWIEQISLNVQRPRNPGSVVHNRWSAKSQKKEIERKPQWLPQSLAIAESLRHG